MPDSGGSSFEATTRKATKAPRKGRKSGEEPPSMETKVRRFNELARAFLKETLKKDRETAKLIGKAADFDVYLSAIPEEEKERLVETVISTRARISEQVARGFQGVVDGYLESKGKTQKAKAKRVRPSAPPARPEPVNIDTGGLDKKQKLELQKFFDAQVGLLTQIVALQDNKDERLSINKEAVQERVEELYVKLIKKLPKKLRAEIGDEAIRRNLESYVTHYRSFVSQLRERIEVPDTKEGQENLVRSFMEQLQVTPEKEIKTDDPLAAILIAEFRKSPRVAEVPEYPRGSGVVAQVERTRVPVLLENAAGWVETSAISVGFMMALKTVFPQAEIILYPVSVACAVAISYGSNIPLKNEGLKEVAAKGKIIPAVFDVVKGSPGRTLLLATTVLAFIAPAVNEAIERGMTSHEVGAKVGEVLDPAVEALAHADEDFPQFVEEMQVQLEALTEAEAYPDRIPALLEAHPGMTFGESGSEGTGPLYWAKQKLFFDENPPAGQTPPSAEMLRIVAHARSEAGLRAGQSLPEALEELNRSFLEETEARRERITELVAEISAVRAEVEQQNIGSILIESGILGHAPTDPMEIERPRAELAELLAAQGAAYEAMRAEAARKIGVMTRASELLLPGSSLSLDLPEFSLTEEFNAFIEVELSIDHPLITQYATGIAELMHQDELRSLSGQERANAVEQFASEYRGVAKAMVDNIGITFSFGATFLIFMFRGFSAMQRGARLREQQEFHLNEARRAEEERIDDLHRFANDTLRKFFPAFPEISRMRVRVALREFMAQKVVELEGDTEKGIAIQHWLYTNFWERSQNSEDIEALKGIKHVLTELQDNPAFVIELIDTMMPGYKQLMGGFDNDLNLIAKASHGGELSDEEIQRFKKRFQSPDNYINGLNASRLEATYAGIAREAADTDLEYSALEHILADIKVGADTYGVFTAPSEVSAIDNRGVTETINAKRYSWVLDAKGKVRLSHEISKQDEFVMRRVAEENEAAKKIIQMMSENRLRRKQVDAKLRELEDLFVVRQLQRPSAKLISIPKSAIDGNIRAIHDKIAAGTGMFEDVAEDVRRKLFGIAREDFKNRASYTVSEQLNAMAESVLASPEFKEFLFALNDGRSKDEQLSVDIGLIYGTKMDKSVSESSIDVPGFALRIRVLDKDKNEVGFEDFQMGKVLMTNMTPTDSAAIFFKSHKGWARWGLLRLETKFRKEWLEKHYATLDKNRAQEGVFRASGNRERDEAWLNRFYSSTVLAWARAEKARELMAKKGQITQGELSIFLNREHKLVYNAVPNRGEAKRALDVYYEKIKARSVLDSVRATGARLAGLTIDLSKWQVIKSSENIKKKPLPIAEYR